MLGKRQGFPAGKAFLETVPEPERVFANLPAEEDRLAGVWMKTREVDEAGVDVLDQHAELLEGLDLGHELASQPGRSLGVPVRVVVGGRRSVRPAVLLEALSKRLGREQLGSRPHHSLGATLDLGQGFSRLLNGEVPHRLSSPAWIQGMPVRTIMATLSCGAALFGLAACGERNEPLGALQPDLPTTVQGAGSEPFVGEAVPDRIVALDAGVAATAWELGGNVVGAPSDVVDPSIRVITGAGGLIDLDAVRALSPDLVLATVQTDPGTLASLRSNPAVPIYIAPASTVDDVVRSAHELGLLLGDPVLAREFAGDLRKALDDATSAIDGREPVRVFIDTGFRVPPDPNLLFFDVLRQAGGLSVPEDALPGASVDALELVSAGPETYLATVESRVTLTALQADDRLRTLPAVVTGQVYVIDRESLDVGGPDIVATLEELVAMLYPDGS